MTYVLYAEKILRLCCINSVHVKVLLKCVGEISLWIKKRINISIQFEPFMIIIGYTNESNVSPTINLIIMIAKKYLFQSSSANVSPNIFLLIKRIHQSYNYHSIIAKKNMNEETFVKKWDMCRRLLGDEWI